MTRHPLASVLLLLSYIAIPMEARGQDRAAIGGIVQDSSGARVPGAIVALTHIATSQARETATDETGTYALPGLLPGAYAVEVRKEGFASKQIARIDLAVGQRATLDLTLNPGNVQDTIEVLTEAVQLDRATAEVSSVIRGSDLAGLPLNGRNWASFMLLAPGATNTGEGNQNTIRYFGRSRDDNNFTLDGVDASGVKDPRQEANLRLNISMEAISEFRVSSSLYTAESGTGAGAQMNLVSKGGTNRFRGSLFEYFRNDKLDARRPIDVAKPPFRLNQFGGSAGGPIVRDRTFFFGTYEGLRQRLTETFVGFVPSAAYKARTVATSPALRGVVDAYKPGNSSTTDADIDQLRLPGAQPWREDSALIKIDHRFSGSTSMFARYNMDDGTIDELRNALLETRTSQFRTQNAVIQLQHIFTPSFLSETKIGMNRSALHRGTNGTFREGVSIPGFITLQVDRDEVEVGTSLSLIENITWIRGRHTLKLGGEIRAIDLILSDTGSTTTAFASRPDFVNNRANSVTLAGAIPGVGVRRPYYFVFAQDEIRFSPSLTGNFGLRYEYYSVPQTKDGRGRVIDLVRCGGFCAPGTPWYFGDRLDFAPRIGLAWSPRGQNGTTVIRAGYGLFYGPGQVDDVNAAIDSIPETLALTQREQPNLSFPAANFLGQARSQGASPRGLQRDRREGYSQQWTLSVQQQLPMSMVAQASYVGGNGHRLFNRTFINVINPLTGTRPFPAFSNIDEKQNYGNSSNHALQMSFGRNGTRGPGWQAQYMWSHSINDNAGAGDGQQLMISACRPCDRGNADWDIRHTFTMTSTFRLPEPPPGPARAIFGGWELSGVGTARTGVPFSVNVSRSASDLPDGVASTPGRAAPAQRPDIVPGVPFYPSTRTPDQWLNLGAFRAPARGTWGNLPRNAVRGPGMWQADIALSKRAAIHERATLSFRAEFFNLFNRAQYGLPNNSISSPAQFGRITRVINATPTGTGGPRQVQFMLRFEF